MAVANASVRRLSEQQRRILEGWLLEFDQSWADGLLDERARRLPPVGMPLRLPALTELVKIDLEHQWRAGRRPGLEDYLRRFPELGTPDAVAADLIQAEYEVRKQFGDAAGLSDLGRRFPGQAPELARLLAEARAVVSDAELARPSGDTKPPHETPPPSGSRAAPEELTGQFGRYRIEKRLGRGGMGSVYLAHDTQLDRRVALKVPHFSPEDGPQVLQRFYREARAAATLDHPNICPVHDVGEVGGVPYLTMAFIEGKPLTAFIQGSKPVVPAQAAAVVRKLALALNEAHRHGVIHRDLKPANVMINTRKEPVVMDFGLARRADKREARLTQMGSIMGTPAYMPPEQVTGDVDRMGPACDVYSLGVILYELLTGRPPFEGDLMAVLMQVLNREPAPPSSLRPGLDPRLEAACLQAMAKKPEDRYASMADLARDLGEYLRDAAPRSGTAPASQPAAAPPPARKSAGAPPRRRWAIAAAAAAGPVLLLGIIIIITTKKGTVTLHVDEPDARVEVKMAADSGKAAGPKKAVVPAAPGPVDLLKLVDLKDQFVVTGQGPWQFDGGALACGAGVFQVPYAPPEEYRMETTIRWFGPASEVSMMFPVHANPAFVILDGWSGKYSGLFDLDGRGPADNESGHAGKVFKDGQANTIVCTVRRDGVQVRCNDQPVIDWKGDPGRLSVHGRPLPDRRALYLGSGSPCQITRWTLTPLAGQGRLLDDPAPEMRRFSFGRQSVTFTPDGRRVISDSNWLLRCWDVETCRLVWLGAGPGGAIWKVAVSPDGQRVLTGGQDGALHVWDAATGEELYHLPGHPGSFVRGVAFSPDGSLAASSADDGTVSLWALPDQGPGGRAFLATHGLRAEYFDGTDLKRRVGEGISRQFNWKRDRTAPHAGLGGEFYSIRWTGWLKAPRPGKYTLTLSADDGIRLWLDDRLLIDEWHGGLATHYPAEVTLTDRPHKLRIEYFQGTWLAHVLFHWAQADGFAECEVPAEALFLNEADARRAEVKVPAPLRSFRGHQGKVWAVAFSPDGKRLVTGGADQTVRLWEVATGKQLWRAEGHTAGIRGVAFAPDGKSVASAGLDQDVRVWNADTGALVCRLRGHRTGVTSVAFTPDGRRLLSGSDDGTLRLWDLKAKETVASFRGHMSYVADVAVSPDGRRAASASWDDTVRVWRLPP